MNSIYLKTYKNQLYFFIFFFIFFINCNSNNIKLNASDDKLIEEFKNNVQNEFNSETFASNLINYFAEQEYDKFAEIVDDISNGFDDCCCKEILNETFKLKDITKQKEEYNRLKKCLNQNSNEKTTNDPLEKTKSKILNHFNNKINKKVANKILELFTKVVEEEEFEDLENVIEDFKDLEQSTILSYILENIEEENKSIINKITNDLDCIINNKTNNYFTKILKINKNKSNTTSGNINKIDSEIKNKPNKNLKINKNKPIFNTTSGNINKNDSEIKNKSNKNLKINKNKSKIYKLHKTHNSKTNDIIIDPSLNKRSEIFKIEPKFTPKIREKSKSKSKTSLLKLDINSKLPSIPEITNGIDIIREEISRIFSVKYDNNLAQKILTAFNRIIMEEQFNETHKIKDDIQDSKKSFILKKIWKDIDEYDEEDPDYKKEINNILQDIVNGRAKLFAIKDFIFTIKQPDVTEATELVNQEVPILYKKGTALSSRANTAEDKSMCIAKAVDLKNGFPILLWLLDSYSRDRIDGHEELYSNTLQIYDKFSEGYNATRWWLDNNRFCKFIQFRNAKIALPMMTAVHALSQRGLPPIEFNPAKVSIIHDDLNQFAKYALASHRFAHNLIKKNNSNDEKEEEANATIFYPTQVDFLIIPEATTHGEEVPNPDFDIRELLFGQNLGADNYLLANLNLHFLSEKQTKTYNEFGECKNFNVTNPIWKLDDKLKTAQYEEGKDYWVQDAKDNLENQFHEMWEKAGGKKHKNRRYIFIIDRRNQKNISKKNMDFNKPTFDQRIEKSKDKIYLIAPKKVKNEDEKTSVDYGEISEHYERIPEIGLGLSYKELVIDIGINNSMNGYKFCLSYHLHDYNQAKVYWYFGEGSQRFYLKDILWLWTRYFAKIKGRKQELTKDIINKINKEKSLPDIKFDEFVKQCKEMKIIYRHN